MSKKILGIISLSIGLLLFGILLVNIVFDIVTLDYKIQLLLLLCSQIILSFAVRLLSYFDEKLYGKLFCVFFVFGLIMLMLSFLEPTLFSYCLFEIFLLYAFVLGLSHKPRETEFVPQLDNIPYILGKSFKAVAGGLFIYWILAKVNLLKYIANLFGTIDTVLIYVFIIYILGAVFTEFGSSLMYGNISNAIRSSIFTTFFVFLGLGIVSYLLMAFEIVGPEWSAFNAFLWKMVLMFFVISILALFLLEGPAYAVSEKTIRNVRPSKEVYEVERTSSTFLGDSLEILVKAGSIAVPLLRNKKRIGYFVSGDISYTIEINGCKLSGEANNLCIISHDSSVYERIKHELKLRPSIYGQTDEILLQEIAHEAEETLNRVRSLLRRRHKIEIVRLPLLKVISGESYEYVKIGPLTVIDTEEGEYVGFGIFGVQSCKGCRKKETRGTVMLISDVVRGDIIIRIEDGTLNLYHGNLFIQRTPQRMIIRRGRIYYKKEHDKISLKWGQTRIELINKHFAKISFDNKMVKINEISIKIHEHEDIRIIENPELAEKLLSLLGEYVSEFPKEIIKGSHLEAITKILRTLDEIINEIR